MLNEQTSSQLNPNSSQDPPTLNDTGSLNLFSNKKIWLFVIPLALIITALLIIKLYPTQSSNNNPLLKPTVKPTPVLMPYGAKIPDVPLNQSNQNVIAKVGDEQIYQRDYEIEAQSYPVTNTPLKRMVLDKLASDSALLQGAQLAGIIKLDSSIYNSPNKDYPKRITVIKDLRDKIAKTLINHTSGALISIWFDNDYVGSLGYQQAKQTALQKITTLHDDVKNKKITAEQAANIIRNDSSLAQLDIKYKSNAIQSFYLYPSQKLSDDSNLNTIVASSNAGDVTDILVEKSEDLDLHQMVDSVYVFAVIEDKVSNQKFNNFKEWTDSQAQRYPLIILK